MPCRVALESRRSYVYGMIAVYGRFPAERMSRRRREQRRARPAVRESIAHLTRKQRMISIENPYMKLRRGSICRVWSRASRISLLPSQPTRRAFHFGAWHCTRPAGQWVKGGIGSLSGRLPARDVRSAAAPSRCCRAASSCSLTVGLTSRTPPSQV